MKGLRFYEELKDKNRVGEKSMGNVIAIDTTTSLFDGRGVYQVFAAVFFEPNSPVCYTGVAPKYLTEHCKRISEARAREIHPKLFERLDNND